MIGYDIDGVLTNGQIKIEPGAVIVSGRTFAEYDDFVKLLTQHCPVYIRGVGEYGDREHAGEFKAETIKRLGITKFYEDDPLQIELIRAANPECEIVQV